VNATGSNVPKAEVEGFEKRTFNAHAQGLWRPAANLRAAKFVTGAKVPLERDVRLFLLATACDYAAPSLITQLLETLEELCKTEHSFSRNEESDQRLQSLPNVLLHCRALQSIPDYLPVSQRSRTRLV